MRKTTLALSISLAGGLALASNAQADIEGLYSADAIMDANVYLDSAPDERIGDVEDILLDDDMSVQAIVIETGATLGLGGRDIVLDNDHYRLETETDEDGDTVHRVYVDATAEELDELPEYNRDWWDQARENAAEAWEATREGAQSAWQRTREGAESIGDTVDETVNN
ncbi:PRC-barrel domain-containing protein [Franzmannia pantelleriensis]|uniref:PRC-barrel domain-containing protein n=1 Tax=Franzmannia pantelleriensis TaxID=48727 RepID=A0A1G9REN0_9GAMM|nr:PRC-barrel domain-containing protein [Halomonas pantelleriensis]SDM21718.1 PRC-barrel domain-containing protein [Halomonas pantelleriensis]